MQSLERFTSILRTLAESEGRWLKLSDVARSTGLGLPTTLRLLKALVAARFVDADTDSKTFALGPELVFLGLAAERNFSFAKRAEPEIERLARTTGNAAYLAIRSGDQLVCTSRAVGIYPVQALTIQVGARWAWALAGWQFWQPYPNERLGKSARASPKAPMHFRGFLPTNNPAASSARALSDTPISKVRSCPTSRPSPAPSAIPSAIRLPPSPTRRFVNASKARGSTKPSPRSGMPSTESNVI